jgi:hypothetical protein
MHRRCEPNPDAAEQFVKTGVELLRVKPGCVQEKVSKSLAGENA